MKNISPFIGGNMNPIILDKIPCELDTEKIARKLHIEQGSDDYADLVKLLETVTLVSRPKAVYKPVFVEDTGSDYVVLDDQEMRSTVMQQNLKDVHRVFAYVSTCGDEVEQWSKTITDILHNWWMDSIKEHVLAQASIYLRARVTTDMDLSKIASMSPGSLPDWPISEQAKLFALLGDTKGMIGVSLTDSMLMTPSKTVSGFFFETDSDYVNCQLCTREKCIGRKVPFDDAKYKRLFG
jgi:hypothetical protein